jgi:L-amino acid N-acyltransferase YncA
MSKEQKDYSEFVHEVIASNPYGRFAEDRDIEINAALRYHTLEFEGLLKRPDCIVIESKSSIGSLYGILIYHHSHWDSSHFAFPVVILDAIIIRNADYLKRLDTAKELLSVFKSECKSNGVRLVMSKFSSRDLAAIHAGEAVGFEFIESWIYNKFDLRKFNFNPQMMIKLRAAREDDMPIMQRFAVNSFATQRFHADKRIPNEKAEDLYQKWIQTSFSDARQKVLVHDVDEKPAAFAIYFTSDMQSTFGLNFTNWKMALIDPSLQGKGLGAHFFHSLFVHHKEHGSDVVDSGLTLRNIASLNLHNKLGFKVTSTLVSMHLWL